MEKKNRGKDFEPYDCLSNAASSTDCTGLIPAAPINDEEMESHEDIYHYLPPKVKPEEKKSRKKER